MLPVVASIAIGTWLASIALYYIGYARIGWVRSRWPEKEALLDAALDIVSRHPWRSALAVRFAYGLRLPLPIACGAARMPIELFTTASGISCVVWSLLFTYLGYAFGGVALKILDITGKLEVRLGLLALALTAVLIVINRRRVAAERRATARVEVDEP
jgi:membrane protein DedA with SNARE-associated domain